MNPFYVTALTFLVLGSFMLVLFGYIASVNFLEKKIYKYAKSEYSAGIAATSVFFMAAGVCGGIGFLLSYFKLI